MPRRTRLLPESVIRNPPSGNAVTSLQTIGILLRVRRSTNQITTAVMTATGSSQVTCTEVLIPRRCPRSGIFAFGANVSVRELMLNPTPAPEPAAKGAGDGEVADAEPAVNLP